MDIKQLHHVAYRCRDAKQTAEFYTRVLGLEYVMALSEDRVPSTGEPHPYMHVFFRMDDGSYVAFFEIPESPPMGVIPESVGITGGGMVGALPNDPVPDGAPDWPPAPAFVPPVVPVPEVRPLAEPLSFSPPGCVAPCAHAPSERIPRSKKGVHRPTGCHPVRVIGRTL